MLESHLLLLTEDGCEFSHLSSQDDHKPGHGLLFRQLPLMSSISEALCGCRCGPLPRPADETRRLQSGEFSADPPAEIRTSNSPTVSPRAR